MYGSIFQDVTPIYGFRIKFLFKKNRNSLVWSQKKITKWFCLGDNNVVALNFLNHFLYNQQWAKSLMALQQNHVNKMMAILYNTRH